MACTIPRVGKETPSQDFHSMSHAAARILPISSSGSLILIFENDIPMDVTRYHRVHSDPRSNHFVLDQSTIIQVRVSV